MSAPRPAVGLPGDPNAARGPSAIAAEIRANFPRGSSSWIYARPYVEAMECLVSWRDVYGVESAREIGLRFLCNAGGWRGPVAARVKAEIKAALAR